MREITEANLADIAIGAAILGSGGGGDPRLGELLARAAIREHGPVSVVGMDEVADDELIVPISMMGAPTVANEKLPSLGALPAVLEQARRAASVAGTAPAAVSTMPIEVGGIAALLPIAMAAELGVRLVDADAMGRAFPELQMTIPTLYGVDASPVVLADEHGNTTVVDAVSNAACERLARAICVEMGSSALVALYAMTGAQARAATVHGSLTAAEELGRAVSAARAAHEDPVAAVVDQLAGHLLLGGKVVDVVRRTEGGFARLEAVVAGLGEHAGSELAISSQNEHLVARRDGEVVACAPDLIMVLDAQTGGAVTTESLRYGMRVVVVASACDPRFRSTEGLALVGPAAFGYDLDYQPVEDLHPAGAPR